MAAGEICGISDYSGDDLWRLLIIEWWSQRWCS